MAEASQVAQVKGVITRLEKTFGSFLRKQTKKAFKPSVVKGLLIVEI
jgi:hypothetical protein